MLLQPAHLPMKTLSSPAFNDIPALQPSNTLKQVSESIAAPAPPPATKFAVESCENPPALIPVKQEPSPQNLVALTIPVAL